VGVVLAFRQAIAIEILNVRSIEAMIHGVSMVDGGYELAAAKLARNALYICEDSTRAVPRSGEGHPCGLRIMGLFCEICSSRQQRASEGF